jgi:hypothetical protein
LYWRCVCNSCPLCGHVGGNSKEHYAGFEDLTAVVMKSSITLDVAPLYGILFQKIELFYLLGRSEENIDSSNRSNQ